MLACIVDTNETPRRFSTLFVMNPQRLMMISVALVILVIAAFAIVPRITAGSASGQIDYASNPVVGNPDAPVKVAIFFDFLCPHCMTFSENITPVLKQEFVDNGTAALYFLNFPVVHPVVSRDLAMVGECVYQQSNDAFITLEPIMLRSQNTLRSRADGIDFAIAYAPGIDGGVLHDCMAGDVAGASVNADEAAARGFNINGTPSVVVNGRLVTNPTLANIRTAINNAAN